MNPTITMFFLPNLSRKFPTNGDKRRQANSVDLISITKILIATYDMIILTLKSEISSHFNSFAELFVFFV